jgi:hypothetical protein
MTRKNRRKLGFCKNLFTAKNYKRTHQPQDDYEWGG